MIFFACEKSGKGEIDKAIAHYQEVLEMDERTGNVEGKS
jgi:hypothetical protein